MGRQSLRGPLVALECGCGLVSGIADGAGMACGGDCFQWAKESRSLMICLCMLSTAYYTRAAQGETAELLGDSFVC